MRNIHRCVLMPAIAIVIGCHAAPLLAQAPAPPLAHSLADWMLSRRARSERWGVARTNPVEQFHVANDAAPELTFDNAALRLGVIQQEPRYIIQWAPFDYKTGTTGAICCTLDTGQPRVTIPLATWGIPDDDGSRYAVVAIATMQRGFAHWEKPVRVTIRHQNGRVDVVNVDRSTDLPKPKSAPK